MRLLRLCGSGQLWPCLKTNREHAHEQLQYPGTSTLYRSLTDKDRILELASSSGSCHSVRSKSLRYMGAPRARRGVFSDAKADRSLTAMGGVGKPLLPHPEQCIVIGSSLRAKLSPACST